MNDNPTLADLLGKDEARRLQEMSRAVANTLDMMFFGRKQMDQRICYTCKEAQFEPERTLSTCCYCGAQACFTCLDTGRHSHDSRTEVIQFGFCLPCEKVVLLKPDEKQGAVCPICKFGWAPRAIRSAETDNKNRAICCYCGAIQEFLTLPFHCGRCSRMLI